MGEIFDNEDTKTIEFYEKYKGKSFRREDIISKSVGNSYNRWSCTRSPYSEYILTCYKEECGKLVLVIGDNYFLPKDIITKKNNLIW